MSGSSVQLSPELLAQIHKEVRELKEVLQNLRSLVPSLAAAMPITFDDFLLQPIADGTEVTNSYHGVTFKSYSGGPTYARKPRFGSARSGNNVISTNGNTSQDCAIGEPDGIRATFSTPQKQVYVWALPVVLPEGGLGASKDAPYLKAFDTNHNLISQSFYPAGLLSSNTWQQLICVSSSANIASVEFSCTVNQGGLPVVGYFDDFAFFQ